MTKKLITAVLCASVTLSTIATATEKTYSDVDTNNTTLISALDNLHKFDIVEGYGDGTFKPDNNVTRAEFAVMTRRMMNPDSFVGDVGGYTLNQSTKELVPWHFAITEINLLKKMQIISGYEDGSLKPDQNVTYNEGIKMLVCALGYKDDAVKKGGWSDGYIECAKELGLLKDIATKDYSAYVTREASAIMVNKALSIPRSYVTKCNVGASVAQTPPDGEYIVDGIVSETEKGMSFEEQLNGVNAENGNVVNKNIVEEINSLGDTATIKRFSKVFYGGGLPVSVSLNDDNKIYNDGSSITIYFDKINKSCDYYISIDTEYYTKTLTMEEMAKPEVLLEASVPNIYKLGPVSTEKITFYNVPKGEYELWIFSMPCQSEVSGVVVVEDGVTKK